MTLEDMRAFLRQARDLQWYPALLLIGGEPTMHPDFYRMCELAAHHADEGRRHGIGYEGRIGLVQVWSNQTTEHARKMCDKVRTDFNVSIVAETVKTRSLILDIDDIFVSPLDMGLPVRQPCWQHCSQICGISVDGGGYSPCAIGGAVDGMLGLGYRTKRLADLFDPAIAAQITERMCGNCGNDLKNIGFSGHLSPTEWRELVASCETWKGMRVSPIWKRAFEGRNVGPSEMR